MLLLAKSISKHFGGVRAVNNLSFHIDEKDVVGLIGPNGSGKTTVLNLITGRHKMDSGEVHFRGKKLKMRTHQIIRRGIGRTFQIVSVFSDLTVLENLLVPISRLGCRVDAARALELLNFIELEDLKNEYARNLSYGQQKRVELARALMLDPELVFLDEPVAGISPGMRDKIKGHIRELNERGVAFLIVEHNMKFIMDVCRRIIVLNEGQKIAEGEPEQIRKDEKVIEAYLGE